MYVLADSEEAGLCLLHDPHRRSLYMSIMLNTTPKLLRRNTFRDVSGPVPANYFPCDDPSNQPENHWRSHAHLLFANWINEVYQTTPFDLNAVGSCR
jgi:homoserine O-succinyltransferase/O-acetyltransferase